jgi:hypothetical protein
MDNLHSPSRPVTTYLYNNYEDSNNHSGFTKLEEAAIRIGQGMAANILYNNLPADQFKKMSVQIAKAILEEANK